MRVSSLGYRSSLRQDGRSRFVSSLLLSLFLLLLLPQASEAAGKLSRSERRELKKEQKEAMEKLPQQHRDWLEAVDPLITDEERTAFLALEKDYQRDAFIKQFWEQRDPYKSTARNEFRDRWESRVAQAKSAFGSLAEDRSRIFLLNGPPAGGIKSTCSTLLWPLEAWFYAGSELLGQEFVVVFYRRWGAGPFRIWNPMEGLDALFVDSQRGGHSLGEIANSCRDGDKLAGAIGWVANQRMGYTMIQSRFDAPPQGPGGEWVSSFGSYSTDIPEGAATLPAKLEVEFPGKYQNRTALQGLISLAAGEAGQAKLGDHRSYNFVMNGELLQGTQLFDRFRYKFDLPGDEPAEAQLPLLFQRFVRPGDYLLILRLEDLNSGKFYRVERNITVPAVDKNLPPPAPEDPESAKLLAEANAAISSGETTIQLIPPPGELRAGMVRFDTLTTGEGIDKVSFALEGKPVLTKRKPPFSVELDLGSLPRPRRLSVVAFDAAGKEIASDEIVVNAAANRFKAKLIEPRQGQKYENSLLVRAEIQAPEGEAVERVEVFLNETRVATLYQPPYTQPVVLPKAEVAYVRVVAYLTDGNSTEDLVFVNAPEYLEQVDVDLVELYTSVLDRQGRPVEGLTEKDFAVTEDGARQSILRFEKVTDLPIHAAVALDISASMENNLDQARQAALTFFQEAIEPRDRAAIVTFNDRPTLAVKFTKDVTTLAGGLAGLKAERGTALYDAIIFSLFYFNGVKGQRTVLLLSDGKDEGSRFGYEDALDYARRAGVTIYAIGLGDEVEKKKLERLAEETGGRSFFLQNVSQLPGIYETVEKELRSKYLIAYQSTNTSGSDDFRTVDLKVVGKPGVEAKTMRGYYP